MGTECIRGREYVWYDTNKDWRRAQLITAGIDVGSSASKAVITADDELFAYGILYRGTEDPENAREALDAALSGTKMARDDIHYIVGTGCGELDIPVVKRTVNEIACHARGANHGVGTSLRTVLAIGGRDCLAIRCKDRGRVTEFLTNACPPAYCRENPCGACGAARGRGIEVVAEYLGVPLENVGAMSLKVTDKQLKERLALPLDKRARVNDKVLEEMNKEVLTGGHLLDGGLPPLGGALSVVCDVLAKSQTSALLRNGWSKEEILAAYCAALAHQAALLVKRVGVVEKFALTGGVAKNIGVVQRLERELGIKAAVMEPDPQLAAALGAALFASDFLRIERRRNEEI